MRRALEHTCVSLLFILFIALIVRLLGITSRPVWYDEAFSVLFSEKGPGAMLYGTLSTSANGAADIHPLAYYTMLWGWMKVFGESLISIRLFSILAGLGTIYLFYNLILELIDKRTAQIASLLLALDPFHVHYSQEVRMYVFLALWLIAAAFAYTKAVKTGRKSWWVMFSIMAAMAQYTHNLAAFFLIPLALYPLLKRDLKTFKSIVVSGIASLLIYFPWLIHIPSQFAKVESAYWIGRPAPSRLFTLLLTYVTNLPLPDNWLLPALFISMAITVVGIRQTISVMHRKDAEGGIWLLYMSFAPPVFLFLFSQWKPVYIERALLPSGVLFCGWLAWALTQTGMLPTIRNGMLGLLMVGFIGGISYHVSYSNFPYVSPRITKMISRQVEPDDIVIHSNKLSFLPALYYNRNLPQEFIGDPPGSNTDTLARATQKVLRVNAQPDLQTALGNANRVWYIIYQRSIDELRDQGYKTYPDLTYLNAHYTLLQQQDWNGLIVDLYTKRP